MNSKVNCSNTLIFTLNVSFVRRLVVQTPEEVGIGIVCYRVEVSGKPSRIRSSEKNSKRVLGLPTKSGTTQDLSCGYSCS